MPLLLIIPHHYFFFFFSLSLEFYIFLLSFFFVGLYVFLFLLFLILLLLTFLLLCFLLWLTYVLFYFSFCPFFLYLVWLFYAVVFFSPCSSSFSSFVFLLPRPPCALEKEKEELSHFVCLSGVFAKMAFRGSLRKCPLQKSLFFLFGGLFFCPQNMFLFDVLGICFEGVRDSLLLLLIWCYFCLGVLKRAFIRSNLSLVPPFFGVVVFFVSALFIFGVSACVVFFCGIWCISFPFLSSYWDCLFFIALMALVLLHALAARLSVWIFWAAFWRDLSRGVVWEWPTGRGQYIFRFFYNCVVWVKTGAVLGEEGFCKRFLLQNRASKKSKQTSVFNFLQETLQELGFQNRCFFFKKKCSTLIDEMHFFGYLVVTRKYMGARFGGGPEKNLRKVIKHCEIGVSRISGFS